VNAISLGANLSSADSGAVLGLDKLDQLVQFLFESFKDHELEVFDFRESSFRFDSWHFGVTLISADRNQSLIVKRFQQLLNACIVDVDVESCAHISRDGRTCIEDCSSASGTVSSFCASKSLQQSG
jgi:hypothetical protein